MGLISDYKIKRYIEKNNSMLPNSLIRDNIDQWKNQYSSAEPFPHIVIDDFFSDVVLSKVEKEFVSKDKQKDWATFKHPNYEWRKNATTHDFMIPFFTRHLVYEMNSQPFINFLEELTGIKCLLPDTTLEGGGLHSVLPQGQLEIHVDFNAHPKTKFQRRVNLLLYLNKNWKPEYGGNLELWDSKMSRCEQSIEPIFNRIVIFNSTDDSFHGHPHPLSCPDDRIRKSIAIYYYTQEAPTSSHSTLYQKRTTNR
ncbi:MAG: 2OG-Fe(II) oxygenase [Proteobacteria bacterium]|nr:MAG: 2OG-Fe(II) oxygenase [Pseudomonadota bacterium]